MEYWCSLVFLLAVSTIQYSLANRPETDKLGFLVSGTPIRYATTLNTTYFNLAVEINFDQTLVNTSRVAIEAILKEWQTYPVFVTDPDFAAPYVSLMQRAIRNLMEAYTYQDSILRYVTTDKIHPLSSVCNFTVTGLTQDELIRMIFNIKEAWSRVNVSWTKDDILHNLDKSNTMRLFHVVLDTETLGLHADMSITLSLIDTLSSSIFPEYVRGLYQSSRCIDEKYSETIKVKQCTGYSNMYVCQIEIQDPLTIYTVNELVPLMYRGIQLRGENENQKLIQTTTDSRIQLLDCDGDLRDTQRIAICSIHKLDPFCESALSKVDVRSVIKFCNFTRPDTYTAAQRLSDGSILAQGDDIRVKVRKGTEFKLLSTANPCRIYSSSEIHVESDGETFSFAGSLTVTDDKVIETLLTKEDIDALEWEFVWRHSPTIFTWEYIVNLVLLGLQIILLPLAIWALVVTIKNGGYNCKKKKKKNKQKNYQMNERLMSRMDSRGRERA